MTNTENHDQEVGTSSDDNPPHKKPSSVTQRFWEQHEGHPDPERAWHDYYASLGDIERYQIWEEYQSAQLDQANEKQQAAAQIESPKTVAELKKDILDKEFSQEKPNLKKKAKKHFRPMMAALITGALVLVLNYNEFALAQIKQFVSPGDQISNSIIIDPNATIEVSDEPRIIIPKINVDVPVVYDITTYNEADIQAGLERGVVHYGKTPLPGEPGNSVIVGHSSNNFFNGGEYKFAFVLLDRLEVNDTFILHYEGTRYIYKIYNKKEVAPTDFTPVKPTSKPTVTLITCTPPGTSWRRLYVQGEQISPEPSKEKPKNENIDSEEAEVVPGNAPSFFQRFRDWVF